MWTMTHSPCKYYSVRQRTLCALAAKWTDHIEHISFVISDSDLMIKYSDWVIGSRPAQHRPENISKLVHESFKIFKTIRYFYIFFPRFLKSATCTYFTFELHEIILPDLFPIFFAEAEKSFTTLQSSVVHFNSQPADYNWIISMLPLWQGYKYFKTTSGIRDTHIPVAFCILGQNKISMKSI